MTVTNYPEVFTSQDPNLTNLSLSRLLARLEHNLLSSSADLKPLRRSEYQRMRVGANIEYARATLQELERSLPQIKPVEHRHEIQSDITRDRQVLKRLQGVLDQLNGEADIGSGQADAEGDYEDEDEESVDGEDLLGTPEGSTSDEGREAVASQEVIEAETAALKETKEALECPSHETKATPTATTATTTVGATASPSPISTLRNRHNAPTDVPATATGSSVHGSSTSTQPSSSATAKAQSIEETLDTHRREQEDITNSLLSLATQLKSSSQTFQSSLESEKSVLARAVEGLDRTTGSMEAAERRMGLLRRMTEGKGWWGRMMLYAWIFGLWLVAVLIVFLGPKLRF